MKKTLILILLIVLGLFLAIIFTIYKQSNSNTDISDQIDGNVNNFPQTGTPSANISSNFTNNISVKKDVNNPGLYVTGGDVNNKSYEITFEKETNYFNVVLLKKPFALARTEAENELKNILKTNNLCDLSHMVSVPGYVDQSASGFDYRFNGCPGSTPL